jgi:hypothetical protein
VAFVFIAVAFNTAVVKTGNAGPTSTESALSASDSPPEYVASLKDLALRLMEETSDTDDTDGDLIPDSVELAIGTDPAVNDTDYDRLDDLTEILNNMDPLRPDSNKDGIPDYIEFNDVDLDVDLDGKLNWWDFDNDGDGVNDDLDISPFSKSALDSSFHFQITTNGNPTYINFQLRPNNADHLRLPMETWDWPEDWQGQMKQKDGSVDDVEIAPVLELTGTEYYWIVSENDGKCLEVADASLTDGANVQVNGRDAQDHKLWLLEPAGGGYYKIVAKHSGKLLEVAYSSQRDDADVWQLGATGKSNQLWKLVQTEDGAYEIVARHSGLCLSVGDELQSGVCDVCQERFNGRASQLWSLQPLGNFIPSGPEISNYALGTGINKITIPLFPVIEYGTTVALTGRLFCPASGPSDISMDAKLVWSVSGKTDNTPLAVLHDNDFRYFAADSEGALIASSSSSADALRFEWIDLVGDPTKPISSYFALRAPNGNYFSVKADGRIVSDASEIGKNESFFVIPLKWLGVDKIVIKAGNGKFISVRSDGYVVANRDSPVGYNSDPLPYDIADAVKFYMDIVDYKLEMVSLARYQEDFFLTGFSVEENYGSDVGLFYDQDTGNTLLAGLALSYGFLRNSTNNLSDMPSMLTDLSISVDSVVRSFPHSHLAMLNATTDMLQTAFAALPADDTCPILFAFEDRFVVKELDELVGSSHVMGHDCTVDITDMPVVTSKTLKANWYDTSSKELIGLDSVVTEVQQWCESQGYDAETSDTVGNLVIVWNAGDSVITRMGVEVPQFEEPEIPEVLNIIDSYGLSGVDVICRIIKGVNAVYRFLKIPGISKGTGSALSSMSATFSEVSNAKIGMIAKISRIQACLDIVAWVVTGIIAFYAFISIAAELGGDYGLYVGGLYALIIVAYAAILFILALTGPVGVAIGIIVALDALLSEIFDVKLPFTLLFDFWVAVIFSLVTDTKICSEVSMQTMDTELDIFDNDDNGLDVGDRIEYRGRIIGNVTLTSDGIPEDLTDSYLRPNYKIQAPNGTNSSTYSYRNVVTVYTDNLTYRATDYETGVRIEPGMGMINFPVVIWLSTEYRIYYLNGYWFFGWNWERDSQAGSSDSERSTIYFDVLPGSLDAFLNWKAITPMDHDGDGIWDDYERGSNKLTDPYRWDTDGDGLSDKFEPEIGTDPTTADSDSDGLDDGTELLLHTDPLEWDTDGDNLSDYTEIFGWVIELNYSGTTFAYKVKSDPLIRDFDGDGLDDQVEYWSGTSPTSQDTDGDGTPDEARPVGKLQYDYIMQWGSQGAGNGQFYIPRGIGMDANGFIYVMDTGNSRVQKFDSDGNYITRWGSMGSSAGQFYSAFGIAVAPNGNVYVADSANHRIQKFTSAGAFVRQWGGLSGDPAPGIEPPTGKFYMPYDVAVDSTDSFVYVADTVNERIQKFTSNGVFLKAWDLSDAVTAVAVDSQGNVYAAEARSGCIKKFDPDGNLLRSIFPPAELDIGTYYGIAVDGDGDILAGDSANHRIVLFDPNGQFVMSWGSEGIGDGQFDHPWGFACCPDGLVYVTDSDNSRVQCLKKVAAGEPPAPPVEVVDIDGDTLLNSVETDGWTILVVNSSGTFTLNVTSDPMNPDTDGDGLTDSDEFNASTDPRSPDTDGDGISDQLEIATGTDPCSWDSDGDGLGDGFEQTFGSDPKANDTDADGLTDDQEYLLGTDPRDADTDGDGLTDSEEYAIGSDPKNSDSDGDLLFDQQELEMGTDPTDPDSDSDGLADGYEAIYGTDPRNNDSDGDLLMDGDEILHGTNPLSNDTDGDGVSDSEEIAAGTNPLQSDSDGDGIIDSEDNTTIVPLGEKVVVCVDIDSDVQEWVGKLGGLVNTTIVSPDDLLANHTNARYIVLVGEPRDESGTAGYIIRGLVEEALQGPLDLLADSDGRLMVRYGVWSALQTVIVLTTPLEADLYAIVSILNGRNVTVLPGHVVSEYSSSTSLMLLYDADTVRATDASAIVALNKPAMPIAALSKYDASTTPFELSDASGLAKHEIAMGRYLDIGISDTMTTSGGIDVQSALVRIFYATKDLDRTGDGYVGDPEDLNEDSLVLYAYNESLGSWERLSTAQPWVLETGVNTTDIEIYGKAYAGYVWALVTHTSLFGVAGQPYNRPPDVSGAYPSIMYLWSPNHKLVGIQIMGVTDPDGDEITITIIGVTSDEPTQSLDGKQKSCFAPDAYGIGTSTAYLRAERLDTGNGRVYVITFVASDGRGGETTGTVSVYVPHDNRKSGPVCIDDGQDYDATGIN